jgi:hypothetical protein
MGFYRAHCDLKMEHCHPPPHIPETCTYPPPFWL